jgi:rare lipoprotein A
LHFAYNPAKTYLIFTLNVIIFYYFVSMRSYFYSFKNTLILSTVLCLFCLQSFSQTVQIGKTFKGKASYYHDKFHGRRTANGDTMDNQEFTCAHRSLPFGTMIEVTNPYNGKWVTVKVNDRGPYSKNRIIDVSFAAAQKIGMLNRGVMTIHAMIVGEEGKIYISRPEPKLTETEQIFTRDSTMVVIPLMPKKIETIKITKRDLIIRRKERRVN